MSDGEGTGTVKWYNPEKAYGFIITAEGKDLFVHRNAIADGRPWLIDGQSVEFSVRQGPKGPEAADVRVTQDVEAIPASRQRLYDNISGRESTGGDRGSSHGGARRTREVYTGPVPNGPVPATVMRVDSSGRFLFAQSPEVGDDVYVHGSLFTGLDIREGDQVSVTIEQSDRGLRARSLTMG